MTLRTAGAINGVVIINGVRRMKHSMLVLLACLSLLVWLTQHATAQGSSAASLSGTIIDPSGAVVPGASVLVKSDGTGAEFRVISADNGTFTVPTLAVGTYTVTATAAGFKRAVVTDVKIDAATPASVRMVLSVGEQSESVVVEGGAEILQTQSANVSTTIVGRQITELPFVSRDALDLVLLLPGTSTPGRPRTSTVNGLPKGALNISIDGINVQDNLLKSSDGFFTYIRPRIDAIEEVTVSTATPGAESGAEGAVQIKFVTRAGTNKFHGSVYEYHRNPALNANYWFNNRDLPPDPRTGKAPRDRVLLNQYGFRLGGPISIPRVWNGRDRAFFFVNYEEYRLPEQVTRQRTILSPEAQAGIYQYDVRLSSGQIERRMINLLSLGAANDCTLPNGPAMRCPSTMDPSVARLLGDIRTAASRAGGIRSSSDPNYDRLTFTNTGGQTRYFPTVRLDFNLTRKHHLENIYNYQKFDSKMDFLNGVDPAFPGFPNFGSQVSNRFSNSTGLRSTLTSTLVNEARIGLSGGITVFSPEVTPSQFANQGGYSLGIGAAGISGATATRGGSRRSSPVRQFSDTLSWTRGVHALNFGYTFTQIRTWIKNTPDGEVRAVGFGLALNDPARKMFLVDAGNFPGANGNQTGQAGGIYSALVGRVTSISGTLALDENTNRYQLNGDLIQRVQQRETGVFVQDSWRYRPNLTVSYGLRWEIQFPFRALNDIYSKTTYAEVFGISGSDHLFQPGTMAGTRTQFTPFTKEDQAYKTSFANLAPSLGIAWSPDWKDGVLRRIFGGPGQSVLRAGYSIAYNREGLNIFTSILGGNPGSTLTAQRTVDRGNLPIGTMLRDGIDPPVDFQTERRYPIIGDLNYSANAFRPNLRTGYVQSWTIGIQREIAKNTVLEFRYVGNRGIKLWRQYGINEINVIENGFFDEFLRAQSNLLANVAAGRGTTFAYFGPGSNTSPLPIILAHFAGLPSSAAGDARNYTAPNFKDSTYWGALIPEGPSPIGLAGLLRGDTADSQNFRRNAATAGLPHNFFLANPDIGGTSIVDNGGRSTYDAFVIELRRRFSRGLLVQGSYSLSKSLTNSYTSGIAGGYVTLRNPALSKTNAPSDIRHGLKANWLYELPIGRGRLLFANAGGALDRFVGGWEFHGTARVQSGAPFNLVGGLELVNMTRRQLQDLVKVRFDDANHIVYFLPQDVIDNTRRAFNRGIAVINRPPLLGDPDPSGRYIAPANSNNRAAAYNGQYGFSNLVLYGPRLVRFDLSVIKRVRISERVQFEMRGEFLNAFNNINFIVGNPANDSNSIGGFSSPGFGQLTQAYRDLSTTNDPGGRLIQFVARLNF